MKKYFLPIVMASLLLAGCSAAYKTGQTPDDVYYSTGRNVVTSETAKETPRTNPQPTSDGAYKSYFQDEDDAYLRMKVRNGGKWSSIDDLDYWYGYNGGCQCNNSWGTYNTFNSFNRPFGFNTFAYTNYYNPWSVNNWFNSGYYYPVIIVNKRPVYTNSSRPGLTGYTNKTYDRGLGNSRNSRNTRSYSNSQFRTIFSGNSKSSNSNSSESYDRPTRTFTPSSNSNSSSGSSSGSSRSSSGSSSSSSSSSGRGGRGGN
jgi:hypothetical protein